MKEQTKRTKLAHGVDSDYHQNSPPRHSLICSALSVGNAVKRLTHNAVAMIIEIWILFIARPTYSSDYGATAIQNYV